MPGQQAAGKNRQCLAWEHASRSRVCLHKVWLQQTATALKKPDDQRIILCKMCPLGRMQVPIALISEALPSMTAASSTQETCQQEDHVNLKFHTDSCHTPHHRLASERNLSMTYWHQNRMEGAAGGGGGGQRGSSPAHGFCLPYTWHCTSVMLDRTKACAAKMRSLRCTAGLLW